MAARRVKFGDDASILRPSEAVLDGVAFRHPTAMISKTKIGVGL
jgi:hypothetical protein